VVILYVYFMYDRDINSHMTGHGQWGPFIRSLLLR